MRTKTWLLALAMSAALGTITILGQGRGQPLAPERTPGVQAQGDPNRQAFVAANCKMPPAPPAGRGAARPGGPAAAAAPAAPYALLEYNVQAIPGIIAAGQRWNVLWEGKGNNADGILGLDDGSLLVAQADDSTVLKIGRDGKASIAYADTYAGGSVAANAKGQLFIGERSLHQAVWLLEPQRRLFANRLNGEPFDCVSAGPLNDTVADSKGGLYMTMNGVFYVNPQAVVSGRHGTVLNGNGITLSPDERTLYVTGRIGGATGGGLVAFDVQTDGSLTNERQLTVEACGDGMTVDSQARIYCTESPITGRGDQITIVTPDGKVLGRIPTPRPVISVAFGGPDKKTLFAATNEANGPTRESKVFSIQMIAEGNRKRPK